MRSKKPRDEETAALSGIQSWWKDQCLCARAVFKWLSVALLAGVLCGVIGSIFHIGVHHATTLREAHRWLLWCLPLAGFAIGGVYKLTGTSGQGTNSIIDEVHLGKGVSLGLLPAIFAGTVLTHLCGGSAGREGAALQMGGTIGYHTGRLMRFDDLDLRVATMTGMAAFFSALFGTPLAAAVFVITVASVDITYHVAFVPCLTASLVAFGISLVMGVEPTRLSVVMPEMEVQMMVRVAVFAALCALVSVLFCKVIHQAERLLEKWIPNEWVRAAAGGCIIVALTVLCGTTDYSGAGMEVITAAVERGIARPEAFVLKLLFTAVTLACGFKGGEVVPSFFVGATFGCVVGPLLGIPAGVAAALGLIGVFCGATNCPIASVFLAVELFGDGGLLYFAMVCGISYMLSGYTGLYSSQTILYSKLKAACIDVHANAAHIERAHRASPVKSEEKE
ncbi:MAG: chloride channel protein [Ruminococcaceae bacterium]|nr:chloride channel protein [Oscillospiraceae bacterium]